MPAESILYSIVTFNKPRKPKDAALLAKMKSITLKVNQTTISSYDNGEEWVKNLFEQDRPSVIQVGGDETTGKGLVQLSFM